MAIREIIKVPNPILKKVSKPVDVVDDEIRKVLDDMLDTMYDAPGIGPVSYTHLTLPTNREV